jgi:hypothetical protein
VSALKPCPFCGSQRIDTGILTVGCCYCGTNGPAGYEGTTETWNDRPIEAALLARAEAAEEKLEKVRLWAAGNLDDGCSCSVAYQKRGLHDPSCEWHTIDTEALDAILAPGGGEKGDA